MFADAQFSRTFLQSATFGKKTATTWAFSMPKRGNEASARAIGPAEPMPANTKAAVQQSSELLPSINAVYAANLACHRSHRVYEKQIQRGKTIDEATATSQKYLAAHLRIPRDVSPEERDALALDHVQLACDETERMTARVIQRWADEGMTVRQVDGMKCLVLPCPAPDTQRWIGAKHWIHNVLADPAFQNHPRVKRAKDVQVEIIVESMAWQAESSTGRWCAITCDALARKAVRLYSKRHKMPRGMRGWKSRTVASNVRAVWAALRESGWVNLRAKGRNLRTEERLVALSMFGIEQTGAGNVFDLIVPQRVRDRTIQRHLRDAPKRPHWAHPGNPFVANCEQDKASSAKGPESSVKDLVHTYLPVGQPSSRSIDHYGSQTHARTRGREKNSFSTRSKPSLAAQRMAAGLVRHMPWLGKDGTGKPVHMWSLSFAVERSGVLEVGFSLSDVVDAWDSELAQRWWEIQPGSVMNPAGWLHTCLVNLVKDAPFRG